MPPSATPRGLNLFSFRSHPISSLLSIKIILAVCLEIRPSAASSITAKSNNSFPGFKATVPFAEGIKRTIASFEKRPEACTVDTAWNEHIDQILAAYEAAKPK